MTDLIERLEAATEGSRELDCEVACALGWKFERRGNRKKRWWYEPGLDEAESLDSSHRHNSAWPNMRWTTSIDAALTLVPEGLLWIIFGNHGDGIVEMFPSGSRNDYEKTLASTVPLAICIAALKAQEGGRDK